MDPSLSMEPIGEFVCWGGGNSRGPSGKLRLAMGKGSWCCGKVGIRVEIWA